jgi:hypothetical protein
MRSMNVRERMVATRLVLVATLWSISAWPVGSHAVSSKPAFAQASNPIVVENQLPGSDRWQIGRGGGFFTTNDVRKDILGYADVFSVNQGGEIGFRVTVSPTRQYTVDFYRMGWYQGLGGRHMLSLGPLEGVTQPDCPLDSVTGLIECQWSPSFQVTVPMTWTSGYYIAVLTNQIKQQSTVTFVVRDTRKADIHYQSPEYRHAAYSNFPRDGVNGKALYDYLSFGANTIVGSRRAAKVSLDRPMKDSSYGGPFYNSGGALNVTEPYWDIYLVRWLERNGYDVTYSSQLETHTNPNRLKDARVVISPAHDEYWTAEMRDAFEAARDAGVNLMFLGANHGYWRIRLEPSYDGRPNRVVVCYKYDNATGANPDPEPDPAKRTGLFRSAEIDRPEQTLVGIQYRGRAELFSNTHYVIGDPSGSWVFSDTGFVAGSTVSGLVGFEIDNLHTSYTRPASLSYTLLTTSPFTNSIGQVLDAHSSIYQAPSGAWVFAAGTMSWSWGLDRPGHVNTGIQKMTENILAVMGISKPQVPVPPTQRSVLLPLVNK